MNITDLQRSFEQHPQWRAVQSIAKTLKAHGYQALLAGGSVRDALLERPIQDFDIATDARPEKVEEIFPKTVAVGKQFGVIRVVSEGESLEVATFRSDGAYVDGRRPDSVTFSSPKEDANRRDFTMNGLFYDLEKQKLIDFVDGVKDLQHNILKTIGNPFDRFSEDKLRILRAVRFSAQLNFAIEEQTWLAICGKAAEISVVSPERITTELVKLFSAPFVEQGILHLFQSGLASVLFGNVNVKIWAKLIEVLPRKNTFSLTEALALLSYFSGSTVRSPLLRLSSKQQQESEELTAILKALSRKAEWKKTELMHLLKGESGATALKLYRNLSRFELGHYKSFEWYQEQRALLLGKSGRLPEPWFKGADLLSVGVPTGPQMGAILKELYDGQLEKRWSTREQALKWLKQTL